MDHSRTIECPRVNKKVWSFQQAEGGNGVPFFNYGGSESVEHDGCAHQVQLGPTGVNSHKCVKQNLFYSSPGCTCYAFANISDNKTNLNRMNTDCSRSSFYDSEYQSSVACSSLKAGNEGFKVSMDMDKISEQIMPHSKVCTSTDSSGAKSVIVSPTASLRTSSMNKILNLNFTSHRNVPSLTSSTPTVATLKRSNAIICRGGLLQFFSRCVKRSNKRIQKWKIAMKRRLFKFHKTKPRMNSLPKRTVTFHQKRTNGYVSNIKRSVSNSSRLGVKPDSAFCHKSEIVSSSQIPDCKSPRSDSTIRRSNSSIKRAATILRSTASVYTATPANYTRKTNPGQNEANCSNKQSNIPKSSPSLNLKSNLVQPSVFNKRGSLFNNFYNENEFSIEEEDEIVPNSNGINCLGEMKGKSKLEHTNTNETFLNMNDMPKPPVFSVRNSQEARSVYSTNSEESDYFSIQSSYKEDISNFSEEFNTSTVDTIGIARIALNYFLRSVITYRINDRLNLLNFKPSKISDKDLTQALKVIIKQKLDRETPLNVNDCGETSYFSRDNNTTRLGLNLPSAIANVRRSLTLPIGINLV